MLVEIKKIVCPVLSFLLGNKKAKKEVRNFSGLQVVFCDAHNKRSDEKFNCIFELKKNCSPKAQFKQLKNAIKFLNTHQSSNKRWVDRAAVAHLTTLYRSKNVFKRIYMRLKGYKKIKKQLSTRLLPLKNREKGKKILRCSRCKAKNEIAKIRTLHKYGDYVVLKPDAASQQKLRKLGVLVSEVITNQLPQLSGKVRLNDPSTMHLTLAMPLHPMTAQEINRLLDTVSAQHPLPYQFDLVFRDPNTTGSYGFALSSPNYSPHFDVRLHKPHQNHLNHQAKQEYASLVGLAEKIQNHCHAHQLVDLARSPDNRCHVFKPHITLGSLTDQGSCQILHKQVKHTKSARSLAHLVSQKAASLFICEDHQKCSRLSLRFDKLEVRRCDNRSGKMITKTLAVIDLDSTG
jgi:hypothetical protein